MVMKVTYVNKMHDLASGRRNLSPQKNYLHQIDDVTIVYILRWISIGNIFKALHLLSAFSCYYLHFWYSKFNNQHNMSKLALHFYS